MSKVDEGRGCRGQWFPDGLTQLALTDVSGSSGSLHEHGVLTDFLQKSEVFDWRILWARLHSKLSYM